MRGEASGYEGEKGSGEVAGNLTLAAANPPNIEKATLKNLICKLIYRKYLDKNQSAFIKRVSRPLYVMH